jgi:exonuclease III
LKALFWNVRGMSKKSVGPFIRDMIHENKFDIVCFQETILKDFPDSCLRKIDPGSCYLWDWISAKGRSGGVFTGIKVDRFDVGNRVQGSFILQHNLWDRRLETKWNVMNVYGAA